MVDYNFKNFKRVSKVTARKLFDEGIIVRIAPCKVNIELHEKYNSLFPGFYFDISRKTHGSNFDKIVNEYAYYKCNYELGYYLAYYIYK